jgi:pyrroline-5-carboxylate reductase
MNIHIIGGGNLGTSVAKRIAKFSTNNNVTVTRRNVSKIEHLKELGITVSTDNTHCIEQADIIFNDKPYQVDLVLAEILPVIKNKIASAVSGLSIEVFAKQDGT